MKQPHSLRVMSYNVQVGIATERAHHYVLHSWKHVLPHTHRLQNLDKVARLIKQFDIVGLQELDAGSLRSNYINLAEYLADRAQFPYWYTQVNRNFGRFAQHSSGLLTRYKPTEVVDIRLPSLIPGRRAIMARYGQEDNALAVFIIHLSLGKRARLNQLDYIADLVNQYPHAILMGDLNCQTHCDEMQLLFNKTHMHEPLQEVHTFPSWRPQHHIDHILVTSDLTVKSIDVLNHAYSDHLPIVMEVELPDSIKLDAVEVRDAVLASGAR